VDFVNIVVCIKQVPDPSQAKIDPKTGLVIRAGVKKILNPFDLYAIEEAVRLKEAHGGKVTALSMGPPDAAEALKEAVAMGVDDAVLLSDRAFAGADTLATSYTLALGIGKIGAFDLIICGRQAVDGDTAQVGPGIAEQLGIPHATDVRRIVSADDGQLVVERMIENGYETIRMPLPALITAVKELNEPRMPSLKGMMRSKKMQVPIWGPGDIQAEPERIGSNGSPTQVYRTWEPTRKITSQMLEGTPQQQARALLEKLGQVQ
jgi:electron transfer flavoprotein beta subunit